MAPWPVFCTVSAVMRAWVIIRTEDFTRVAAQPVSAMTSFDSFSRSVCYFHLRHTNSDRQSTYLLETVSPQFDAVVKMFAE